MFTRRRPELLRLAGHLEMRRLAPVFLALLWPVNIALSAGPAPHLIDCPATYSFAGSIDFFDAAEQQRIRGIESNHLNANVENLRAGQSGTIAGDLRFILNIIPNHQRAMAALARLAMREKTDRLPDLDGIPVRCWLHRATVFNPGDGQAAMVYGVYLSQVGLRREALDQFLAANRLMPDDPNVSYNLGLLYFDLKEYAKAREQAQRAYAGGFPLAGLRNKLQKAGHWP